MARRKPTEDARDREQNSPGSRRAPDALYAAALIACAAAVFLPSLRCGFVNWDDDIYVYENPRLRALGGDFWSWAWTTPAPAWHPLTLLSLGVDHFFWGLDPLGYHLTNLIFHALNAGLVFLLLARLSAPLRSGRVFAAAAALLFALHPQRVESVTWISERKDVLCGFFSLAGLLAFVGYSRAPEGRRASRYGACLLLCALALLSKPMAVSLPLTFLILDYYPLRRTNSGWTFMGLILEKVPFLALSAGAAAAALWSQAKQDAVVSAAMLPWPDRLAGAARALAFYLVKTAWPAGLAPLYPWPIKADIFGPPLWASAALLLAVTSFCLVKARENRIYLAAWLYTLASLAPVLGLVQVGSQFAADRYMYLPCLGPLTLAAAGFTAGLDRLPGGRQRKAWLSLAGLALALLAALTVRQQGLWRDSLSLWSHEVRLYPGRPATGHLNLGGALKELGRGQDAAREFTAAVALSPEDATARGALGAELAKLGRLEEALSQFQAAVMLKPDGAAQRGNLGAALLNLGRPAQAARQLAAAVRLKPDFPEGHYNLGLAYKSQGRLADAVSEYSIAVKLRPDYAEAHNNLGEAYMRLRRPGDAAREYRALLGLDRNDPVAHFNLGMACESRGLLDEARMEFTEALRLSPDFKEALIGLSRLRAGSRGETLSKRGRRHPPGKKARPCRPSYPSIPKIAD